MAPPAVPYWRLSALYFFYFTIAGVLVPFWGLYLQDRGFSGLQIGIVIAVMSATKIGAPNLWGWVADKTGQHTAIVRWATAACALCFAGVMLQPDYAWLLVVMVLYSFFWNAVLPQYEVITLHALQEQTERYSRIRVWGSIGFIVFVVGLGFVFDFLPIRYLPIIVLLLLLVLLAASCLAPKPMIHHAHSERRSFIHYLKSPVVIAFFVTAMLAQVAHGAYYAFFTLYMESHHYSRGLIGGLWAVGVIAEVVIFLYMHQVVTRWSAQTLMAFSFAISVLRWLVIALFPESLPLLLLVQLGHAATFAIVHSVSIQFVHERFPAAVAGQGQALYSAVSFGLGGAIGNLSSGWLWEHGNPAGPFLMAAAVSFVALLIILAYFKPHRAES